LSDIYLPFHGIDALSSHEVAIVVPCYNCELTIQRAIDSVLLQTYSHWKLYLVDDESTDCTWSILDAAQAADSRIAAVRSFPHRIRGPYYPRNVALALSSERFVCFLDADDEWLPSKLQLQLSLMLNNDFKMSCTAYRDISQGKNNLHRIVSPPSSIAYAKLLRRNYIGLSTVMIDKSVLSSPGHLRFPFIRHEDYALWLSLMAENQISMCAGITEILVNRYLSPGSVSANKLRSAAWIYGCYRFIKLSRMHSLWLMFRAIVFNVFARLG